MKTAHLLSSFLLTCCISAQEYKYNNVCKAAVSIWFYELANINQIGNLYPDPQYRAVDWSSTAQIHYGWAMIDRAYYNDVIAHNPLMGVYDHEDLMDPYICFLFFVKRIESYTDINNVSVEDTIKIHYAGNSWQVSSVVARQWIDVNYWYKLIF